MAATDGSEKVREHLGVEQEASHVLTPHDEVFPRHVCSHGEEVQEADKNYRRCWSLGLVIKPWGA